MTVQQTVNETTTLYRLFDAEGALLYVGISWSLLDRMNGHLRTQPWWHDVCNGSYTHYATRAEALDAEATAIRDENPLHNKARPGAMKLSRPNRLGRPRTTKPSVNRSATELAGFNRPLTVAEAATRLSISKRMAHKLIAAEDFPVPTVRIGSLLKVMPGDIDTFMADRIPFKEREAVTTEAAS